MRAIAFIQDRRLLDRDDAICDALRTVVGDAGLSPQAEADIWVAGRMKIEAILHLADSATVARLEAEALARRLDNHQELCPRCGPNAPCGTYVLNVLRLKRMRDKADRAYQELCSERRR